MASDLYNCCTGLEDLETKFQDSEMDNDTKNAILSNTFYTNAKYGVGNPDSLADNQSLSTINNAHTLWRQLGLYLDCGGTGRAPLTLTEGILRALRIMKAEIGVLKAFHGVTT
jgi:hypothetical protein